MNVYMLRDKKTGLWYKRHHGRSGAYWVAQQEASIWTTPAGPTACLGAIGKHNAFLTRHQVIAPIREPEIVPMTVTPGEAFPVVTMVDGDDWEGFYVNGKLIEQGHRVPLANLFRELGLPFDTIFPDMDWLGRCGHLPKNLDDVVEA
jgi:hypothetical protein